MKLFNLASNIENFKVNKGSVNLVSENSDYRIQYSDYVQANVNVQQIGSQAQINVGMDMPSESITINTFGLNRCNVTVDNGILEVHAVCPKSSYMVGNGLINAFLDREICGTVSGKVNLGLLKNSSNLDITAQHIGQFNPWNFMSSMNHSINLTGDMAGFGDDYTSSFEVGNGNLNIQ